VRAIQYYRRAGLGPMMTSLWHGGGSMDPDRGGVGVAKKKARGVGLHVRIDPDLVRMAKGIAPAKGQALGDYLSDLIRPPVSRDYAKEMERLKKDGGLG